MDFYLGDAPFGASKPFRFSPLRRIFNDASENESLSAEVGVKRFLYRMPVWRAQFAGWFRVHFFRMWTAATVVMLFGVAFWYAPEFLTWWQKSVLGMINNGSALLPYPWSNRLEFIMVSLGASIWLQITLAIIAFRVFMWPFILWFRRRRMRRSHMQSAE